jgi:hypothetical protein
MQDGNKSFIRSILWLSFFITILISWVYVFQMSSSMKLDWFGNMKMGSMADGRRWDHEDGIYGYS